MIHRHAVPSFGLVMIAAGLLAAGPARTNILDLGVTIVEETPTGYLVEATDLRWPDYCTNVEYRLNSTLNHIPHPSGGPGLPLEDARGALIDAMATWSDVPTSYIAATLIGDTSSPAGPTAFDMVNEIKFTVIPFAFGFGPTTVLFGEGDIPDGTDIDLDGDVDFLAGIDTCIDYDDDGDIEHPAGFYEAGTILDADVELDLESPDWVIAEPGAAHFGDDVIRLDVEGVALHEIGHNFGLAHSLLNESSTKDGSGATMWPGDYVDDAFSMRTLHADDEAWISLHYPEGMASSGPAALQRGDVAFAKRYNVLSGTVNDVNGEPMAGAQPYAIDLKGNLVAGAISGAFRYHVDAATFTAELLPKAQAIPHGRYRLPVRRGIYFIGLQAADGTPFPSGVQTISEGNGSAYWPYPVREEYWSGPLERAPEWLPGLPLPVIAVRDRHDIDFVVDPSAQVVNVNEGSAIGVAGAPPASHIAVRMPTSQLTALDQGSGILIQAALFGTLPWHPNHVTRAARAMIVKGSVDEAGVVDLDLSRPLLARRKFLLQDADLTPLFIHAPAALGRYVTEVLAQTREDLFVVLELTTDELAGFPGTSPTAVLFDAFEEGETFFGTSYVSFDGVEFFQAGGGVHFGLQVRSR